MTLLLAIAMWPETLVQLDTAFNFPRPLRLDYLLILWGAVPWLWRHRHPLWWANRREFPGAVRRARAWARMWWSGFRHDPEETRRRARRDLGTRVRSFFGLA